jgi:3-isopropylmalate dehydrogenase
MPHIAVIPGDGIGSEVTREAIRVLETSASVCSLKYTTRFFDYGAERYLRDGVTLPEGSLDLFRNEFDAIFLGALGDPRIPDMRHAKDILFGLRFGLDLYANQRPVKLLDRRLCPLKETGEEEVNFIVMRENTEGMYSGAGGIFKKDTPDEVAIQESINTRKGVERIIRHAFQYARENGLQKVIMSDKSNAMRYEGDLWQRVFYSVSAEFPDIQAGHLYIDALTMQMVKNPGQFQVIVTGNLFGDIITDLGAQLQGGMGMAASANIHPGRISMFEPVHGSAPKYAGKNVANPMGAMLTVQLLFEHLGHMEAARLVERSVVAALKARETTPDIGGALGTYEVGDAVCRRIAEA